MGISSLVPPDRRAQGGGHAGCAEIGLHVVDPQELDAVPCGEAGDGKGAFEPFRGGEV